MRRGKEAGLIASGAVDAFQHGAGGTFAIRPRDMDEPKRPVRVAGEFSEPQGIFEAELAAEKAQPVEELNGFRIGHPGIFYAVRDGPASSALEGYLAEAVREAAVARG